jgi:D-glycero-D-manno-heptose 1,7-bisphosphate phosphatase
MLLDGLGCWMRDRRRQPLRSRTALFLDRDGVIIEDLGYLSRPDGVKLIEGAASALAIVNSLGIPVVVVTNQSGIGRGFYGWSEFETVQDAIEIQLAKFSAHLDLVLACGHFESSADRSPDKIHAWRKPNPGMLIAAAATLELDLASSFVVGDRIRDLEAGRRAGVQRGALVRTGAGRQEEGNILALGPLFQSVVTESLAEAVNSHFLPCMLQTS